jgi:hypothetical protein
MRSRYGAYLKSSSILRPTVTSTSALPAEVASFFALIAAVVPRRQVGRNNLVTEIVFLSPQRRTPMWAAGNGASKTFNGKQGLAQDLRRDKPFEPAAFMARTGWGIDDACRACLAYHSLLRAHCRIRDPRGFALPGLI